MEANTTNVSLSGSMASSSPQSTPANISPHDSGPAHSSATADVSKGFVSSSDINTAHLPSSKSQVNLRSCITCRRRKIRCNKLHPCSNCAKAKVECVFPQPGRAPRKSKKATETELLARLKSLEAVVKNFRVTGETQGTTTRSVAEINKEGLIKNGWDFNVFRDASSKDTGIDSMDEEMGRLVVSEDKSRYVSHRFWTRFGDEIEELKDMIDCPTSDEEDNSSPGLSGSGSSQWTNNDGFLFGFWSVAHSLREFHLPPERFGFIWETYLENVAPVVPIFHRPSLRKTLFNALSNLDSVNRSTEALLFTVYYTTITSLTPEQCLSQLGEDRDAALKRYRFAVEQSFARANLLNTHSFVLLQSLILFLICARQNTDSRYVLSMTAVAIQIARGIGLHRDGTTFGLTPFETEMRRRLWLQICVLDFCASEDHGCDPVIHEASYDTSPPSNINDEDISPDLTDPPKERVGCTDMTFLLFRCDIITLSRRLTHVPPSNSCKKFIVNFSHQERVEMVENLGKHLENKYVQHCDMTVPIQWVCGTLSRLVVAKLLLMIHHPMTRADAENSAIAGETQNRLFFSSIEIIEFSLLLESNSNTSKWSWLFRTHMQWHALAYVLSNLCVRQPCPLVDRAWRAVNAAYGAWEIKGLQKKGMLWPSIRKLMTRALQVREVQLQQLASEYGGSNSSTDGHQPHSDFLATQYTTSNTYVPQPSQFAGMQGVIHTVPVVDTGFSGMVLPDHSSASSADASMLSWPSLPQNFLYNGGLNLEPPITSPPPPMDEWYQIVREFQLDVRSETLATDGHIPMWFE